MSYDPAYGQNANPGAPMPGAAPNYYAAPAHPQAYSTVAGGSLASDGARSISKPLMGLLGLTAGFPIVAWVVAAIARPSSREVSQAQFESMQLVMQFACRVHAFTPEQALYAATVGGAQALALHDRGALAPGLLADIQVWDVPEFEDVIYRLGSNAVSQIVLRGKLLQFDLAK